MPTALTQFQIEGLHGRNRTIDIPIRDNRLVLVGENGTGKSTVANLIYYTLTQQWRRIAEYRFSHMSVRASDALIRFTHEDIEALASYRSGPLAARGSSNRFLKSESEPERADRLEPTC
jgi:predicted ATP-binding protein involved in virulence